jgi:hypothetical protein
LYGGGGGGGIISPPAAAAAGTGGAISWSGDASDWVAEEGGVVAVVAVDMKETGLALTVGQSDAAEEETGLSLRDVVELVSDMCGEYLRCSAGLLLIPPPLSIVRTRLALLAATTFAVLIITGEARARTGVADTRPSLLAATASGIAATGLEDITAVEG